MKIPRLARRLLADRGAMIGGILVLGLVALATIGPRAARHDPTACDIDRGLSAAGAPLPPSGDALLGTDELGRDVWARVIAGAGTSLEIATLATALALALGLAIGLCAGYAGGGIDRALMRLVDLVLAFPFLLVAMLLAALLHGADLAGTIAPIVITLGVIGWTTIARVVRGKAMVIARSEHVAAARALGASPARIVWRHVLPNVAGVAIVLGALGFAQNLLAESVLSYLGLGPPPPAASWGRMLFEGRTYYQTAPWIALAPGIAIVVAVVGFNLLGEGLRDALAPKDAR
ncbi:MAG TPA: ABC transporter permease [Kofleriaceae bacterium]|nr:ABC transporter permease [Kofleriaceae bacterium]